MGNGRLHHCTIAKWGLVHHYYHHNNTNILMNTVIMACWYNSRTIIHSRGVYKFYGFLIDPERFDSPPVVGQERVVKEGKTICWMLVDSRLIRLPSVNALTMHWHDFLDSESSGRYNLWDLQRASLFAWAWVYILKKVPARLIYGDTFRSLAFVHVPLMALNIYFLIILVTFGEETAKHFTKNPLGNNLIIIFVATNCKLLS